MEQKGNSADIWLDPGTNRVALETFEELVDFVLRHLHIFQLGGKVFLLFRFVELNSAGNFVSDHVEIAEVQ